MSAFFMTVSHWLVKKTKQIGANHFWLPSGFTRSGIMPEQNHHNGIMTEGDFNTYRQLLNGKMYRKFQCITDKCIRQYFYGFGIFVVCLRESANCLSSLMKFLMLFWTDLFLASVPRISPKNE